MVGDMYHTCDRCSAFQARLETLVSDKQFAIAISDRGWKSEINAEIKHLSSDWEDHLKTDHQLRLPL